MPRIRTLGVDLVQLGGDQAEHREVHEKARGRGPLVDAEREHLGDEETREHRTPERDVRGQRDRVVRGGEVPREVGLRTVDELDVGGDGRGGEVGRWSL